MRIINIQKIISFLQLLWLTLLGKQKELEAVQECLHNNTWGRGIANIYEKFFLPFFSSACGAREFWKMRDSFACPDPQDSFACSVPQDSFADSFRKPSRFWKRRAPFSLTIYERPKRKYGMFESLSLAKKYFYGVVLTWDFSCQVIYHVIYIKKSASLAWRNWSSEEKGREILSCRPPSKCRLW